MYLFLSCSSLHFLSHDASLFLSPDEPPLYPAPASLSNDLALRAIMALYSPGPYSRYSPRDGGLTRGVGVGLLNAASRLSAATATAAASAGFGGNPDSTLLPSQVAIDVAAAAVVVFVRARP